VRQPPDVLAPKVFGRELLILAAAIAAIAFVAVLMFV
jgi:hypothetical protein